MLKQRALNRRFWIFVITGKKNVVIKGRRTWESTKIPEATASDVINIVVSTTLKCVFTLKVSWTLINLFNHLEVYLFVSPEFSADLCNTDSYFLKKAVQEDSQASEIWGNRLWVTSWIIFHREPPEHVDHVATNLTDALEIASRPPMSDVVDTIWVLGGVPIYKVIFFRLMC